MPELPEVEVARRNLERWLSDRRVVRAEADDTRIFRGADRKAFTALRGRLLKAERKGKYLLLSFEKNRGLLSHFGMTGKWVRRPEGESVAHSRARLRLDSGEVLHYRDPRLFGRIEPAPAEALWALPQIAALGIDALDETFGPEALKAALGETKQDLKVALMDQSKVAGLGNLHAAEALFRAKLHPACKPAELPPAAWRALAKGVRDALVFAIERETGDEIAYVEEPGTKNPFFVYGRKGEKCRRCKTEIEAFSQGGRTTYFCPHCQEKRRRK